MVPLLLELSVMFAVPLIIPDRVSVEVLTPLFLRTRLLAPNVQVPVLTTGVAASAAKLMPAPATVLVKLLGSVIVAPPEPRSGAKPATSILMAPLPKAEPLL